MCEICLKLPTKTPQPQQISYIVLEFLLLPLNKFMLAGCDLLKDFNYLQKSIKLMREISYEIFSENALNWKKILSLMKDKSRTRGVL